MPKPGLPERREAVLMPAECGDIVCDRAVMDWTCWRFSKIGWQHEHEHRQLVEIQKELNSAGDRSQWSGMWANFTGSF